MAVLHAVIRGPKDKAKVENAVLQVERRILKAIKNMTIQDCPVYLRRQRYQGQTGALPDSLQK